MSFGGGGGGAPKAPNTQKVIAQQQQANIDVAKLNAQLNRVNQVTPFGNLTYSNKGNTWTATQTLDPLTLGAIQNNTRLAGDTAAAADSFLPVVQGSLANRFSLDDFAGDRKRVEDALISRLTPYLNQQGDALDVKLANQGIVPGSEAYNRSIDAFGRQKNDAYLQAILDANDQQAQQFQLAQAEQNQPLNQFLALKGQPTIQGPSYINAPQTSVANTDVAGITTNLYNAKLNAYNAAQSNASSGKGNLLGLAGTIGGAFIGGPAGAAIGGSLGSAIGGGGGGNAAAYAPGATSSFFGY